MHHVPADPMIVSAFVDGGRGPDVHDLHLDLHGKYNSDWNKRVAVLVLERMRETRSHVAWAYRWIGLEGISDNLIVFAVTNKIQTLLKEWKKGQPKALNGGNFETLAQAEQRVITRAAAEAKRSRHYTRRYNVRQPSLICANNNTDATHRGMSGASISSAK